VIEEGPLTGGLGGEVVARLLETAFDFLQAPPKRVAAADVPVPASRLLEQAVIPDYRTIAEAAAEVVAY
jgi:pyruvate/2-oxoglutarate/acetoin dehydrogenase E1 component